MKRTIPPIVFALALSPLAAQAEAVNVGHFDGVQLRGGGHVVLRHGPVQSVNLLKGSTQVTHFHIEDGHAIVIDACDSQCPGSYDLEVEITSPDIRSAAISGGGAIGTAGAFPDQEGFTAAIQGGGDIDVTAIGAARATAAIDGGGRIRLAATAKLTAAVNGGGEIGYRGNPQVTQAVNGGGSIERLD